MTEVMIQTRFWIYRKCTDYHEALESLNNSMNETYTNPMEIMSKIILDQFIPRIAVAANYMKSGYNRGIVKSINRVNQLATVFFCDYGTTCDIKIADIRRLM